MNQQSNDNLKIGVLGGRGMLGSDLVKNLGLLFKTTAIDKDNHASLQGSSFDVLINANGNSRRFWAENNIYEDFEASTVSVYRSLFDFKFGQYIYISSSDVYPRPDSPTEAREDLEIKSSLLSPYGFHKRLSEQIVLRKEPSALVLRLCAMLGSELKKGPVYDILERQPLFITPDSRLQFISTSAISEIIKVFLNQNLKGEIVNVAGEGSITIADVVDLAKQSVTYQAEAKKQTYEMNVDKIKQWFPVLKSHQYITTYLHEKGSKKQS